MKVLLLYWLKLIFQLFAPNPPYIVSNQKYVQLGEAVVLNAYNCSGGVVNWSTGNVGSTITINVGQNLSITATCTIGGETSIPSDPVYLSIAINKTDCNENEVVNTQAASQYNIVSSYNTISSESKINNPGKAIFSASKKINLEPGFETQTGVVFKAEIEGCQKLKNRTVIDGLDNPWEILWGPDNNIWFTERGCKIGRVNPITGVRTLTYNIPGCIEDNEGGSLGMVLDPNFLSNHYIYVVNVYSTGSGFRERLFRCVYNEANNTIGSLVVLLQNIPADGWHNGSRLAFGADGKLYMTTGDAINSALAQNLSSLNGKVLRINADGTVPSDNPFGNYVWSYGHRNSQGLVWFNNILYASEHGPSTNDEFNIIERGRNYGWSNVEGYCSDNNISGELNYCFNNNIKEAVKAFTPIEAPSGIDFYSSSAITQWTNSVLIACLRGEKIIQLKMDNSGKQVLYQKNYFFQEFGRLRDMCISPDGRVFVCVDSDYAKIIEISKD